MKDHLKRLESVMPTALCGSVVATRGATAAVAGLPAPIGAVVEFERPGQSPLSGEVIGFHDGATLVHPCGPLAGIRCGSRVRLARTTRRLPVGEALLGRVIDVDGRPLDGGCPPPLSDTVPFDGSPPTALSRPAIRQPLWTGLRVVDGLWRLGRGQRVGIFAGSGVGKSSLLGMVARHTSADVNVVALIGERGREVNAFLERDLEATALRRTVVVVATSDEPPVQRVRAAMTATAVAEFFRDRGQHVLLLMDSLTRCALAQRELGLAAGEPPAARGFPPSVHALLPRLIERAGATARGSITALYTVLVEGDDANEPLADALRGLLDGHLMLSRELATRGHFPAVDVLNSVSRLMPDLCTADELTAARSVQRLLAVLHEYGDLIALGAYRTGSDRQVDAALALRDEVHDWLRQSRGEYADPLETNRRLRDLAQRFDLARGAARVRTTPRSGLGSAADGDRGGC